MATYTKWAKKQYGSFTVGKDDIGFDVKFFGATSGAYLLWDESADKLVMAGAAKLGWGSSGSELTYTAGTPIFTLYATNSGQTSTNAEPFYVYSIMTGVGGYGGRSRFHTYTNVKVQTNFMPLKSHLQFGAAGNVGGLAAGFCSEVAFGAASIDGTYTAFEGELVFASGATCPYTHTSFFYLNASGTGSTIFDTNGVLFDLQGLTSASTKILYDSTVRCLVGSSERFLFLSPVENTLAPCTTNGSALGSATYMWSDLFLASDAVINFNNGNVTVTHASGSLSIAGSTAGTTLNITSAAPTAANNGIYSLMTSSAAWTGSLAAIRGRNTVTVTGAGGNCYGGWFNLLFSSGAPTGLGLSAGLYVEAGSNIATTGVSSVLMATLLGDADGAITNSPILTLADASTLKTNILLEVGFNAGATTVGTASSGTTKLYRTSVTAATMNGNCTEALRVMVNGNIRWIPLATSPD